MFRSRGSTRLFSVAAIVTCSLILSALFGMNGVWSAFPAAEAITLALTVFLLKRPQSVCG